MMTASWTIISWLCHLIGVFLRERLALAVWPSLLGEKIHVHPLERVENGLCLASDTLASVFLFLLQLSNPLLLALFQALDVYRSNRWLRGRDAAFATIRAARQGEYLEGLDA